MRTEVGSGPAQPAALPGPALLFCPANRPDRFWRAATSADAVILDLEDAIAPTEKADARRAVVAALTTDLDPLRTIVRINAVSSRWSKDDVRALDGTPLEWVMLPKAETAIPAAVAGRFSVVALCETARGATSAQAIADSPSCQAIAWGGQDLAADLGDTPLDPATQRLSATAGFARLQVRFAAAAASIPAIDTVWVDLTDEEGLRRESAEAAAMGFDAKLVIHPGQVGVVRSAFRPHPDEVAWASRIVACDTESNDIDGVTTVDGEMVDRPVRVRARRILRRAGLAGAIPNTDETRDGHATDT